MYTFVKVGSPGWVEVVLVRLSWTTASWHGVLLHHRTSAPDQSVVTSHCRDYGGCLDHSSEAHEQSSEPCIVFYSSLRAFRSENFIVAWFDGQLRASWWPLIENSRRAPHL
jgi:hypothetical protein